MEAASQSSKKGGADVTIKSVIDAARAQIAAKH